jgi:hypothetical protein
MDSVSLSHAPRPSPERPLDQDLRGYFETLVGKMGIDAIVKSRHNLEDFETARPKHWGKVKLKDFL